MELEAWRGGRILGTLLGITAAGTELFWALFFAGALQATETPQDDAFERAFPVADTWMSACCLIAARELPKRNARGYFFGIAAGSTLIFLALMDILYSLENGKYRPMNGDRAIMAVINVWTLSLGSCALAYLWRERDLFFAQASS